MSRERLRYHQLAFDVVNIDPIIDPARLKQLEEWERTGERILAGSLREFLSLERWADGQSCDIPSLLKKCEDVRGPGMTLHWGRNSWHSTVHILLDDRQDPAVFLQPSHGKRVRSFSQHLFDELWVGLMQPQDPQGQPRLVLNAVEPDFGPVGLDFLTDHFTEGLHYIHHGLPLKPIDLGQRERRRLVTGEYRFFIPGGRIEVTSMARVTRGEEGVSRWKIVADDPQPLLEAVSFVWRWGTLSQTLQATSPEAENILQRLRDRHSGWLPPE